MERIEQLTLQMSEISKQISDLRIEYNKLEDELIKEIQRKKQNARNKIIP